jgi:hypothetical protein
MTVREAAQQALAPLLLAGFARHQEEVMRFQGREQPVIFFAFTRH